MKKLLTILFVFFLSFVSASNTNAVARARTEKVVTLKSNSSSTELQSLLDQNKGNQYNLTIKIPAGHYQLYKELRVYSNTTLLAQEGALFLKRHDKGAIIANDLTNDKGGYTTASNITIIGGIWDSSKVTKGMEGFRFIHANQITIKGATIRNVPEGSKLILLAGVKNVTIEDCTLYGYGGTRIKEAIQLDIVHDANLVPSMQQEYIYYDDLACDGINIINNEIYDYPRAIGSHTSVKGVFHKNITIAGNLIYNIDEVAIKAYNYVNLLIKDNTITNASAGVLAYTYIENEKKHYLNPLPKTVQESIPASYNITIEGNVIKKIHMYQAGTTITWGDGIRIIGSRGRPITGVSIKKNNIADTKRMGIYVSDAPETYVGSNIITRTNHHGIYVDRSYYSKVYYNKIYQPGKASSTYGGIGISASSKSVVFKNIVKNAAKNGIFLYNNSTSCTISTNTIVGSLDNGISVNLSSDHAKITYNKITGTLSSKLNNRGIFVYGADYAKITKNTITNCRLKQEINTNHSIESKLHQNIIK